MAFEFATGFFHETLEAYLKIHLKEQKTNNSEDHREEEEKCRGGLTYQIS